MITTNRGFFGTSTKWAFAAVSFLAVLTLIFALINAPAKAAAVSWDGGGAGNNWSTCENWSGDSCPGAGDDVTIDVDSATVVVDAAPGATLGSLTLGNIDGLTTGVTLEFGYAPIAGTAMDITNNFTMYAGTDLTHTSNTTSQAFDIEITIGGDMIVSSGATINLNEKGYQGAQSQSSNGSGPGAGSHASWNGGGAGHGGDGGDGASNSADGGGVNGSTFVPITIGSSGASAQDEGTMGGDGGGAVRLTITGDFQLDGDITADAGPGIVSTNNANGGGGGAGGTVNIVTGTLSCTDAGSDGCDTTPTITANGGNGADGTARDGGGGSGGRVLIRYGTTTMQTPADFDAIFSAIGGDGDPDDDGSGSNQQRTVEDGMSGTVLIIDEATDTTNFLDADVWIISGFYFLDADKNDTSNARWRFNDIYISGKGASGVNLADLTFPTSASILDADGTMTLKDTAVDCTGVSTLEFEADTMAIGGGSVGSTNVETFAANCTDLLFDVNTGITSPWDGLAINMPTIDFDLPASTTLTLSDTVITTTTEATTGFTIDDAITLNIGGSDDANTTTITSNTTLDLTTMTIFSGSTISANATGCDGVAGSGANGEGPSGSEVCTTATTGYGDAGSYAGGGAGHGGLGGTTVDGALAGATYDTAATPSTYSVGSSGAGGEGATTFSGDGGGYIKIDASASLTINGTISADGEDGDSQVNNGAGGGSGGSIWIITGTLAGDSGGVLSADGGDGGASTGSGRGGGGGGGGLVYVNYDQDSSSFYSSATSANTTVKGAGGTGAIGNGGDGGDGVLTTLDDAPTFVSAAATGDTTIQITMSETINSVTFGGAADWSATGITSSAVAVNGVDNTIIDVTVGSLGDTSFTAVDLAFATGNGGDIQDAGGNAAVAFSGKSITDGQAPTFVSAAATSDTNIQLTMSEAIGTATFGNATEWNATGITSSGVAINGDTTKIDVTVGSIGNTAFTASDFAFATSSGVIQDAASNSTAAFSGKSITDGQAPAFSSAKYQDTDNDGDVDTLELTWSEAIATNSGTVGDFTYVANDITSSSLASGSNGGETSAAITLTLGTPGAANITSHSTAPTLAYTFSSGALEDSAGNQAANFTAQNLSDGAAPVISSFEYQDNDADGKIDTVRLNMSETLDAASVLAANDVVFSNVGDFTGSVFGTDATDQAGASGVVDIALGTEATVVDTLDDSGNIAITSQNSFSLTDGTNTNTTLGAQSQASTLDGAPPVISDFSYEDNDSDGKIDQATLTFSESVVASSVLAANDLTFSSVGDFTGMLFGSGSTDLITGTVSSVTVPLGTESTVIDTVEDSGNIAFSSQNSFQLDDINTNGNSTLGAQTQATFTDGAAPAFVSAAATSDTNIQITMSEDINSVTFGGASDWNATGLTSSAVAINGTASILDLTVNALSDTSFTASDFAFATGSGGDIQDAASNATAAFSSKSITDAQAPAFASAKYQDTDNDGDVDTLELTWSEAIATNSGSVGDFTYVANDITFSSLTSGSNGGETASAMTLTLGTSGAANTTSHSTAPTLAYTFSSGAIQDSAGNQAANFSAQNLTDGAAPIITNFNYQDNDSDGMIDRIVATFSETVSAASVLAPNDLTFSNVGDFTGMLFGTGSTDSVTGSVTTATLDLGTESTVIDTAENSGNIAVTSQNSFSLTDGTNTNTTLGAQSSATFTDGALPLLVSSDPADNDQNVSRSDDVTMTFSEPITTASFTYTCCGTGTDPGTRAIAWSSGDTVATMSHAQFQSSEDITIDITAAPDSSSNAFGGAISGSGTDPFTFKTAAAGGITAGVNDNNIAGGSTIDPTLTLASPNGGESYSPGEKVSIGWTQKGRVDLVNILFSPDNGSTWETITSAARNLGYITWTIPDTITTAAKILIQGTDNATTFGEDRSNDTFSIEEPITSDGSEEDAEVEDIPVEPDGTVDVEKIKEPLPIGTPVVEVTRPRDSGVSLAVGDVFRGVTDPAVYVLRSDGSRAFFPNSDVFNSYFDDFDNVLTINDDQLRKLPLGKRVTMRPGTWLVKIQSDPKVYAVEKDGVLRHVPDESTARFLYGQDWSGQVRDVNVAFFSDYSIGSPLPSNTYLPDGTVFKYEESPQLFVIQNRIRRLFLDAEAFVLNNFQERFIRDVSLIFEFDEGAPVDKLDPELLKDLVGG